MGIRKSTNVTLEDFKCFDDRAATGMAVARAVDAAQPIPSADIVRTHQFDDFLRTLTPQRFELLKLSQTGNHSIGELAVAAGRDRRAVSKDIATLVELGLVDVVTSHGTRKIVRPVTGRIEISALPT